MAADSQNSGGSTFRFKRFSVKNGQSGLKVGTDGVLLGAATDISGIPEQNARILDIGTGTGIIALMLAQRMEHLTGSHITGIEKDKAAADEATENFRGSPWKDRLECIHTDLASYADSLYTAHGEETRQFDLIVSNPPFFENSLKAEGESRNAARHTDSLSYREVLSFSGDFLSPDGRVALILPKQEEKALVRFASSFGFFPCRMINIHTVSYKMAKRIIAEFSRSKMNCRPIELTIQKSAGEYTEEYRELTGGFYL